MSKFKFLAGAIISVLMFGCTPQPPKLEEMQPTSKSNSRYESALQDMNTLLEVYLPPDYGTRFYHIKSIRDTTGVSRTTEIPPDITPLVRDALSQIHYKVRHIEQYSQEDLTQLNVENAMSGLQRVKVIPNTGVRTSPHYTIAGSISQFDRNLSSTSASKSIRGSVGGGTGQADVSASSQNAASISRLGVSFSVYDRHGVSCPGKFGATVDVAFAKNGMDLGFAIYGAGIGFGTEATAMHGRHQALQMLAELSIIQIIGRTMTIPYWRVGADANIFDVDPLVVDAMKQEFLGIINDGMIIPFTQMQCIANGDTAVSVTGRLDNVTLESLGKFADKYGVKDRSFPNFELYKALDINRVLDTSISSRAWASYKAFKSGVIPVATPKATPAQQKPARTSSSAPSKPNTKKTSPKPAAPAPSSPDYDSALEGLL